MTTRYDRSSMMAPTRADQSHVHYSEPPEFSVKKSLTDQYLAPVSSSAVCETSLKGTGPVPYLPGVAVPEYEQDDEHIYETMERPRLDVKPAKDGKHHSGGCSTNPKLNVCQTGLPTKKNVRLPQPDYSRSGVKGNPCPRVSHANVPAKSGQGNDQQEGLDDEGTAEKNSCQQNVYENVKRDEVFAGPCGGTEIVYQNATADVDGTRKKASAGRKTDNAIKKAGFPATGKGRAADTQAGTHGRRVRHITRGTGTGEFPHVIHASGEGGRQRHQAVGYATQSTVLQPLSNHGAQTPISAINPLFPSSTEKDIHGRFESDDITYVNVQ